MIESGVDFTLKIKLNVNYYEHSVYNLEKIGAICYNQKIEDSRWAYE